MIGVDPARAAPLGHRGGEGAYGVLEQSPGRSAIVGTDAQNMTAAYRGAQLELAAHSGGRGGALVEHGHEAGRADHDICEIAGLEISQRLPLPASASDQPQAGILPLGQTVSPCKSQRTRVTPGEHTRL